ncbi:hypothetical protein I7860_29745 [Pseudomonas tolaasii]|uniref:hypothetical protein n=1 Tax=Pseudomonas tolaasii TaxID=29442 RepID=UPI001C56028C|nr:hypothetical protein [Pseudomonas tolaasii]MBW1250855.1 hypothetical protein [Pseudomonas tolaasii]WLH53595.1 hypothetical protein PSH62_08290 [Pseudomonas tolaasii]
MMLLRTLVLERSGQDAPVNGALLCGFAVAQSASNFLVYSLDEETEPGNSRVYIAALRKKNDRYFLGGVESKEDLQGAMQVFKQILTMAAASGARADTAADMSIPFHFIDLKGCKLPPARPEDHHSMIIKKALVMKVITLGMTAPASPAIESASLIVPSIRFSSQMAVPVKPANPSQPVAQPRQEAADVPPLNPVAVVHELQEIGTSEPPALPEQRHEPEPQQLPAPIENASLMEVDSTLASLAKVAQELTQQKRALAEREQALDQWQNRLQYSQSAFDEKLHELEQRDAQLQGQKHEAGLKAEKLTRAMSHLSGIRQRLQDVLAELDQTLQGQVE